MKYLEFYENGVLIGVGTGDESENGIEITEEAYNAILTETEQKMDCFGRVISGEIAIDEVPIDWREEIQRLVNERIEAEAQAEQDEISGDELLNMLEGIT